MKRKTLFKSVFTFGVLFLCACTSVTVDVPTAQIEPPMAPAKTKLSLVGSLDHAGSVEYSGINERPPRFVPKWTANGLALGGLRYALLPYLKLGVGLNLPLFGNFGYMASASLGLPFESPFRLSVYGDVIVINSKTTSGDQKNTFGNGGYNWKGTGSSSTTRTGISMGYLVGSDIVFYLGYGKSNSVLKVKTEQEVAVDDPGGTFEQEDKLSGEAAGFGLQFGAQNTVYVSAQRVWQKFQAETREENVAHVGIEIPLN